MNMIMIEYVDKWYGDYYVLVDINEIVVKGEVVVVCGLLGLGKLMFIWMLNWFEVI